MKTIKKEAEDVRSLGQWIDLLEQIIHFGISCLSNKLLSCQWTASILRHPAFHIFSNRFDSFERGYFVLLCFTYP